MAAQVNGDVHSSSATLQHITGYPLVSDALTTFKSNPYGQKSIELGDSAYKTFAAPVLPYLSRPYQYVSPYVQKADYLGAGVLNKVDERLPVLKTPTKELYSNGKQIVFYPVVKGKDATDHVFSVYNSEYKKVGGDGVVTYGKALISTGLVVTTEALNWIGDILRSGQSKAKEAGNEAREQVQQ
ncbi:uncharacterized protein BCR38DRAFT_460049 [Pseudomassariella vexata]|uniref:Pathogenesis associated protein Cap20 n=1 Tax=Pseudomassariella vexata TaxID=1141098 RepID=A0A1Y2DN74_9PEZI|nr:uncharacterized protein BCR38DRAFT_460049 [Pseudomassariella vexata]ORY60095.1 hypothetical protein BCR38DRAFT_460049 [Pseudomassariella vexata]